MSRRFRPAAAVLAAGIGAFVVAYRYLGVASLQNGLLALVAVALPIAIVGAASLVVVHLASETRPPRWVAGVFLAALAFVSAVGPARLFLRLATRASSNASGTELGSDTDVRAAFVLLTAREEGPAAALSTLRRLVEADPQLIPRGHDLAHEIGRRGIERSDFDLDVLDECSFDFASGCFHGVIERYFYAGPAIESGRVPDLCEDWTGDASLGAEALECSHGLGHGFAIQAEHQIQPAIDHCDRLRTDLERGECDDGVFMEVAHWRLGGGHAGSGHAGPPDPGAEAAGNTMDMSEHDHAVAAEQGSLPGPGPEDLTAPCSSLAPEYQRACWAYQYVSIRAATGGGWERTFDACRLASTPDLSQECAFGAGKAHASEHFLRWDASYELCGRVGDLGAACISGAVEHLIDYDWSTDRAFGFCEDAPRGLGAACYRRVGQRVGFLRELEDAAGACDQATADLVTSCLDGVRETELRRRQQG